MPDKHPVELVADFYDFATAESELARSAREDLEALPIADEVVGLLARLLWVLGGDPPPDDTAAGRQKIALCMLGTLFVRTSRAMFATIGAGYVAEAHDSAAGCSRPSCVAERCCAITAASMRASGSTASLSARGESSRRPTTSACGGMACRAARTQTPSGFAI